MGWQGISRYEEGVTISGKGTREQLGESIVLTSSPVKIKTWFREFHSRGSARIFLQLQRVEVKIDELTLFSGRFLQILHFILARSFVEVEGQILKGNVSNCTYVNLNSLSIILV